MAEDDSRARTPTRKAARNASSHSAIEKLAEARFLIDEEAANSAEAIAYVHAVLCQISLPRTVQKARVWTRANGSASLTVVAGGLFDHDKGERIDQPLPQGPCAYRYEAQRSLLPSKAKSRPSTAVSTAKYHLSPWRLPAPPEAAWAVGQLGSGMTAWDEAGRLELRKAARANERPLTGQTAIRKTVEAVGRPQGCSRETATSPTV